MPPRRTDPSLPVALPLPPQGDPFPRGRALAVAGAATGFPSPADDFIEAPIDLNRELIPSPLSTFFMRVRGDAMGRDAIVDGDLLVVDRSVEPRPGMVVVAVHGGRFVVRRLEAGPGGPCLRAGDGGVDSRSLAHGEETELRIWGVVIHAIHHLHGRP